jgi:hypothetical protein
MPCVKFGSLSVDLINANNICAVGTGIEQANRTKEQSSLKKIEQGSDGDITNRSAGS